MVVLGRPIQRSAVAHWARYLSTGLAALLLAAAPLASQAQSKRESASSSAEPQADVQALLSAVVRVRVKALPDARSNASLGDEREGTGIVIDDRGTILTIGYIVIESDSIEITTSDNKTVPATLVGYDHATGFGLLRASAPLAVKPIQLGDSAALSLREPVMVLPFGGRADASLAYVVSVRPFAGSWEYMLDNAIFTSPPSMSWAGAALVNREAKLVGVGSLLVRDSAERDAPAPGNLFVPIDLLKPILGELMTNGKRAGAQQPWLGLATEELQGHLLVTRVSPGSPAEQAGIKRGDIVVGVGAESVKTHAELYRKMWGLGPAGVEVPLKILQGPDVKEIKVKSIDRFNYFRAKPTL